MPKLHKKKSDKYHKIRPVVAKFGNYIEIASKYCNYYLTKLILHEKSYLKDSFTLLKEVNNIHELPNTANLLKVDAISMSTNIETNHVLQILSELINHHAFEDKKFPKNMVIK